MTTSPNVYGEPDPEAVYTHCAKCGLYLTDEAGLPVRIPSGRCPECGSEDIIEAEGPDGDRCIENEE